MGRGGPTAGNTFSGTKLVTGPENEQNEIEHKYSADSFSEEGHLIETNQKKPSKTRVKKQEGRWAGRGPDWGKGGALFWAVT